MTQQSQQFLLKLSRRTLEHYFATGKKLIVNEIEFSSEELKEKRGTFVTLHRQGELRGCIGHIEPVQEVYKDVIDNALSAAFEDNRFLPLTKEELKDIDIEISVLTKPEQLEYSSVEDLLNKLKPLRDGVIIRKGYSSATYLPQVWEDFADPPSPDLVGIRRASKEEFLLSLCMKAGLSPDEWKDSSLEISVYQAEAFSELPNSPL